jgi:hypothetical protein
MLKHRLTHRSHSAERDDLPINFLIDNFEPRHACGRATVGSRHAAGIQKQNRSASFISRHVRVPVQHGIDISRRLRRRNMLETEFQSTANEIDNQRPFEVGVTISAHESDSWTDCAKFVQNPFCADISEVPDFICISRHLADIFRQTIVRISQNENPGRLSLLCFFHLKRKSELSAAPTLHNHYTHSAIGPSKQRDRQTLAGSRGLFRGRDGIERTGKSET